VTVTTTANNDCFFVLQCSDEGQSSKPHNWKSADNSMFTRGVVKQRYGRHGVKLVQGLNQGCCAPPTNQQTYNPHRLLKKDPIQFFGNTTTDDYINKWEQNSASMRATTAPDMCYDVDTAYGRGKVTHPGRTVYVKPNKPMKKPVTNGVGSRIYGLC